MPWSVSFLHPDVLFFGEFLRDSANSNALRVTPVEGRKSRPTNTMKNHAYTFSLFPPSLTKSPRRLNNENRLFDSLWFTPNPSGGTTIICDDVIAAELLNFAFSHPYVARHATLNSSPPLRLGDGLGVSFEIPICRHFAMLLCRKFVAALTDDQVQQQLSQNEPSTSNSWL